MPALLHAATATTNNALAAIARRFNITYIPGDYVQLRTDDRGTFETILESPATIRQGCVMAQFRDVVGDGWHTVENGRVSHPSNPAA